MQDIAGCRIVVEDITTQDVVVQHLRALFDDAAVVDRRKRPSHGYRAVHVIATIEGSPIEIQVRTSLQHQWAELSEKYSDIVPGLKYGEGDPAIYQLVTFLSRTIGEVEVLEARAAPVTDPVAREKTRLRIGEAKDGIARLLELFISDVRRRSPAP